MHSRREDENVAPPRTSHCLPFRSSEEPETYRFLEDPQIYEIISSPGKHGFPQSLGEPAGIYQTMSSYGENVSQQPLQEPGFYQNMMRCPMSELPTSSPPAGDVGVFLDSESTETGDIEGQWTSQVDVYATSLGRPLSSNRDEYGISQPIGQEQETDNYSLNFASSHLSGCIKSGKDNGARLPIKKISKRRWSPEEDSLLVELVMEYGVRNWSKIATKLNGRVGKQCRERWINNLRPNLKNGSPWTPEEVRKLIEGHKRFGNKWAEIAKLIPGRAEATIKNYWYTNQRQKNKSTSRRDVRPQSSMMEDYLHMVDASSVTLPTPPPRPLAPPLLTSNPNPFNTSTMLRKRDKCSLDLPDLCLDNNERVAIKKISKRRWSREEDSLLIELVKQYGVTSWTKISTNFDMRAGKQCRERWINHLRPNLKNDSPWTEKEQTMLIEGHKRFGTKWAKISKLIPGRAEATIKNYWYANQSKKNKNRSRSGTRPQSSIIEDYLGKVDATPPHQPLSPPLATSDPQPFNSSTKMKIDTYICSLDPLDFCLDSVDIAQVLASLKE